MSENVKEQTGDSIADEKILFAAFLESTPPGTEANISDLFSRSQSNRTKIIYRPDIQLHCDSTTCQGVRFFACHSSEQHIHSDNSLPAFLSYFCRNCRTTQKLFAILLLIDKHNFMEGQAFKIGEFPSFGPPIPSRVISLIGPDREIFIRGRRAENQRLGIGAFAYYRRVVENQKGRLITEIEKVAKRLGASPEEPNKFEVAAKETQFSKAIEDIKGVIPQVLLISGHNPLSLLHSALSEGLHAGTDEECLKLATSIRVVLTELAERISQALKDEAELKQAISKLMQPRVSNN